MDLTEKCLKDCLKYHKVSKMVFLNWRKELQNALIIEFFDSVGIYIEIECSRFNDEYGFDSGIHFDNYKKYFYVTDFVNTRKEATKEAIIKANEIYNNLFLPK